MVFLLLALLDLDVPLPCVTPCRTRSCCGIGTDLEANAEGSASRTLAIFLVLLGALHALVCAELALLPVYVCCLPAIDPAGPVLVARRASTAADLEGEWTGLLSSFVALVLFDEALWDITLGLALRLEHGLAGTTLRERTAVAQISDVPLRARRSTEDAWPHELDGSLSLYHQPAISLHR
jgi:hypothetical protein